MTHWISGVVAKADLLARIAAAHALEPPTPLSLGDFAFLALDEDNLHKVPGFESEAPIEEVFEYLTPRLFEWLRSCSVGGDLVYVETA